MSPVRRAEDVFLHPGDFWFGDEGRRVHTILGSCVAVTLWNPARKLGGMCHYMLPVRHGKHRQHGFDDRYADEAIAHFRCEIARRHGHPSEYEAKLFGGACMFIDEQGRSSRYGVVHDRNVDAAHELMARHGFRIKAEHLGGYGHRQVVFDLRSGHVWMRQTPLVPAEGGA